MANNLLYSGKGWRLVIIDSLSHSEIFRGSPRPRSSCEDKKEEFETINQQRLGGTAQGQGLAILGPAGLAGSAPTLVNEDPFKGEIAVQK